MSASEPCATLTDEGLLAELQDFDETAAEDLALGEHDRKHKKH